VSSLIESSSVSGRLPDDDPSARIIHFDAMQPRKERMRRTAAGEKMPAVSRATTGSTPQAPPILPVAEVPTQPVPESRSAESRSAAVSSPNVSVAPAVKAGLGRADLESFLIGFVVEQTGYPVEMVELDVDLEADLGIDSIKKAQLFGEMAEQFGIQPPADAGDISLDDFPTLGHVVNFLEQAMAAGSHPAVGGNAAAPAPVVASSSVSDSVAPSPTMSSANGSATQPTVSQPAVSQPAMNAADLEAFLVNFVVDQTGYPTEMVELDADLEADLGIDSIKKAQLFGELAEQFGIQPPDDASEFSLDDFPTLRHIAGFLQNATAEGASAPAASMVSSAETTVTAPMHDVASVSEPAASGS